MTMMTTITTTTRRGKFSTASTVLLLCVALLITKSCGIYALSGDSNVVLLSQADAWNQVDEGSGWDEISSSSVKPEETTEAQPELTTTEEVGPKTTSEVETTTEAVVETTAEPATTTAKTDEPQQDTTVASTSSPSNDVTTSRTTETEPVATTLAPTPAPVFRCPCLGLHPHISGDCTRFYNCHYDFHTRQLVAQDLVCPPLTVFSPTYKRCTRDLSECSSDEFVCPAPGYFAASSDSLYYVCVPKFFGGYYKYLVRCSPGSRYEPMWRRCWRYDWTKLYPGQSLEASDLAAIKLEQKQIKAEEKQRIKEEKQKEKEARKQKELEEKQAKKEAKKKAKEQAKANKSVSAESLESEEFIRA